MRQPDVRPAPRRSTTELRREKIVRRVSETQNRVETSDAEEALLFGEPPAATAPDEGAPGAES